MNWILYGLLYWWVVTALLGLVVAFVLPLRRRWLVIPMVCLALVFIIPTLVGRHASASSAVSMTVLVGIYVLFWTAGVYGGSSLRGRLWRRLRHARTGATADPPVI